VQSLWPAQVEAITNLEASFAANRPCVLIVWWAIALACLSTWTAEEEPCHNDLLRPMA